MHQNQHPHFQWKAGACNYLLAAIVVYRLPWTWGSSKLTMKFIHAGLNLLAFALVVISMVAVFDFHNSAKIPNMYSLHSWLGLTAVLLYCLQVDASDMVAKEENSSQSDIQAFHCDIYFKINPTFVFSSPNTPKTLKKVVHILLWLICQLNKIMECLLNAHYYTTLPPGLYKGGRSYFYLNAVIKNNSRDEENDFKVAVSFLSTHSFFLELGCTWYQWHRYLGE